MSETMSHLEKSNAWSLYDETDTLEETLSVR